MIIEELYSFFSISVSHGRRKICVDLNDFSASYFYDDHEKNWKPITLERLWQFLNKYRGRNINGYNRPSILCKKIDTKTLKSEGK